VPIKKIKIGLRSAQLMVKFKTSFYYCTMQGSFKKSLKIEGCVKNFKNQ